MNIGSRVLKERDDVAISARLSSWPGTRCNLSDQSPRWKALEGHACSRQRDFLDAAWVDVDLKGDFQAAAFTVKLWEGNDSVRGITGRRGHTSK